MIRAKVTKPVNAIFMFFLAFLYGFLMTSPPAFSKEIDHKIFLTNQEFEWIKKNDGKIQVAPDPFFPPLEYFNEKGELEGIAVDYLRLIEKKLGIKFKIVKLKSFEEILDKAKKGEIELACTVINTKERSEYLNFTSPYISIPNVIVVRNDIKTRLEIEDLKNMPEVVYQGGYSIGKILTERYGITHIKAITNPEDALKDLSMGRINAMVGNLATISYYSKKMNLTNLKVAGDCRYDDTLSFASRKDLPILNTILEKTLGEISQTERDSIRDKWIKIEFTRFYEDKNFWITTVSILFVLSGIITLLFAWNRTLKRLISIKTHELQRSEEKYRSLIENSPEAIFVIQEGFPVFSNPASFLLTGLGRNELMGKDYNDLIFDEDKDLVTDSFTKIHEGDPAPIRFLYRITSKDGSLRWVDTNAIMIEWEERPALLVFVTDVTDRKLAEIEKTKLEQHLVQAQKMEAIGRLAGGVAHDFNNMLTAILGHTELAMLSIDSSAPLYKDLEEINYAAERSTALTRQLLSFARKQTALPKVINLNDTVENMLRILARLIGENIELAWRPENNLEDIKIDPGQVDQILTNLIVNARDAIDGKSGRIAIETKNVVFDDLYCSAYPDIVPGEYVMLSVCDNGRGMDKKTKENIFEPFFTTKESGQGTGLGLATVYGIVKQNSGYINVYSEPGKGTSFKIYFRRHSENEDDKPMENFISEELNGTETILLVEDEKVILALGKSILERYGYNVLTAASPDEAIKISESHESIIHLLLSDIVMPGMNGLELARSVSPLRPEMKILFMSGYTADIISRNGILKEGMDIIQKPFTARDIAFKARQVLDSEPCNEMKALIEKEA